MNPNVRNFFCWAMFVFMPVSVFADGLSGAVAHPYGAAWLNGAAMNRASAIFPGDSVQTNLGSVLKINASDTSITVLPDSFIKFHGDSMDVLQGGARLATSTKMSIRAGKVSVIPSANALTEFEVTHAAGVVKIVALKGDLKLSNGTETTTISQGQQATQNDADQNGNKDDKQKKKKEGGAIPAASAFSISDALAVAAIGGMLGYLIYAAVSYGPSAISPAEP